MRYFSRTYSHHPLFYEPTINTMTNHHHSTLGVHSSYLLLNNFQERFNWKTNKWCKKVNRLPSRRRDSENAIPEQCSTTTSLIIPSTRRDASSTVPFSILNSYSRDEFRFLRSVGRRLYATHIFLDQWWVYGTSSHEVIMNQPCHATVTYRCWLFRVQLP